MSKETENLASQFRVIPHLEERDGVVQLPNGMRKVHNGLIIDPDKLDLLLHPKGVKGPEVSYVQTEDDTEAPALARRASAKVARRAAAAKKVQEPPAVKKLVTVRLIVPGVGEIPAQYEKVLRGKGVMILGVFTGSFIPRQVTVVDGELNGVVVFAEWPEERYVFNGWEFRDESGVRCLVMVKVPERVSEPAPDEDAKEDYENDEEGEQ